jgi:hypothetical protein
MAYQFTGPNTAYVPKFDEQARLIINYSRDPKKNLINELHTLTPVNKQVGKFPKINPLTRVNVTNTYGDSRKWGDGDPAPSHSLAANQHEWFEYFTQRYEEGYPIGYYSQAQAEWDVKKVAADTLASRLMKLRAYNFYTELQTAGNYTNTDTATNYGGGQWSAATSANRYIQKGLAAATEAVIKSTGEAVAAEDLVLVIGPVVAHKTAASGEIADYLAQNPIAEKYLTGALWEKQTMRFGLPPFLYGIKVVVDSQVRATNALGATDAVSFMAGDTSAYLIARQGGLVSGVGSNFSFIHAFVHTESEMLVEEIDDPINKRTIVRVVDDHQMKVVAKEAAALITSVVA